MTKKSVRKSGKVAPRRKDGINKAHFRQFTSKLNGVSHSVGLVGAAERNAIGKHWKFWDWMSVLPGYAEAEAKGDRALRAWQTKLNGGKKLTDPEVVILNRCRRIREAWGTLEDACSQPSVIAACCYKPREPGRKEVETDWQAEVVKALEKHDDYVKVHAPDKEALKARRAEKKEQEDKDFKEKYELNQKVLRLEKERADLKAQVMNLLTNVAATELRKTFKKDRDLWDNEKELVDQIASEAHDPTAALDKVMETVAALIAAAVSNKTIKAAVANLNEPIQLGMTG